MLSPQLQKELNSKPALKQAIDTVINKFEKRVSLVGHLTPQTMHLMAVELQSCFIYFGFDARIVMEKAHTSGQRVKIFVCSPEEEQKSLHKGLEESSNIETLKNKLREIEQKILQESQNNG